MSKNDSDLLFQMEGVPPLGTSISLALQHLVAMIVGCVTPAIIIANAAGLPQDMRVLLIQSSLVVSAISTLIQVYPIGGKKWPIRLGAGLPVILGISFAYLPSMQAIVESTGSIGAIAGAMVVGGIVAIIVGLMVYEQIILGHRQPRILKSFIIILRQYIGASSYVGAVTLTVI